jgi:hypothetical protein
VASRADSRQLPAFNTTAGEKINGDNHLCTAPQLLRKRLW